MKKRVEQKIEKLLKKAFDFRSKENALCDEIAQILIKEYGYPCDTSVIYQESDGYVVSYWDDQRIDNMPVEECLRPYKAEDCLEPLTK